MFVSSTRMIIILFVESERREEDTRCSKIEILYCRIRECAASLGFRRERESYGRRGRAPCKQCTVFRVNLGFVEVAVWRRSCIRDSLALL